LILSVVVLYQLPTEERGRGASLRQPLARRRVAGISRPSLARQACLCCERLRSMEKGRSWPHPATLERLAVALGLTVVVLTGEKPVARTAKPNGNGRR
jgi:hypothetical protein